jgi:protein phosphatase
MGTTLLAAWFTRTGDGTPQLVIAHVGDSRLYRYRKSASGTGELQPLTRDHTTVQELIDGGLYPPEEVRRLVRRNYLTRAIGIEPTVDSDLRTLPVAADDLFILCSDGLSGLLEDSQILAVIAQHPDPAHRDLQSLAQQLADAANERGGHDNISVVLARLATSSLPSA